MSRRLALIPLILAAGCTIEPMTLTPCPARDPACVVDRREAPLATPAPDAVRFFAVGDPGLSDAAAGRPRALAATTLRVAQAVDAACEARGGCDFGVMLGDNVYEAGVAGPDQAAFFEELLRVYTNDWKRPIAVVLGNHDWGPVTPSAARAQAELAEIARLGRAHDGVVRGATHFFELAAGPVELFAWDTNLLARGCAPGFGGPPSCAEAGDATLRALAASSAPFRVWLGHHPYWSNGQHGDAGEQEECFGPVCVGLWPGEALKQLFDRHVVGQADLVLSGHDHSMQAFVDPRLGRSALVVSGAAAKESPLGRAERRRPAAFARGDVLGFALVEAEADTLTVTVFAGAAKDAAPAPAAILRKVRGGDWSSRAPAEAP